MVPSGPGSGPRSRSSSGSSPSYCWNCGESLGASMNFCPNCGEDCGAMGRPSRSSASDRDVLEYRITKAIEAGWELEHDFGDHAVMVRRNFGSGGMHFVVAFFTIWWTMGLGNALYALYCYYGHPDRMVLRPNHVDASGVRSGSTESGSWAGPLATAIVLWIGTLLMFAFAGASATLLWTAVFTFAAIGLALSGIGVLPPAQKRLSKRRSIATNGWNHVVEERSVSNPDEPCTGCASPIGQGVERTYREELTALGLPITSKNEGTNHYCRQCANAEFGDPARSRFDTGARSEFGDRSADRDLEPERER